MGLKLIVNLSVLIFVCNKFGEIGIIRLIAACRGGFFCVKSKKTQSAGGVMV
jgi:hypothetical protein